MFKFLVIAAIIACNTVRGQTPCSVCGEGKIVTTPDAIFTVGISISCGELQETGQRGEIPEDKCAPLQALPETASICNCAPGTFSPVTLAPVILAPVTLAPVTLAPVTLAPVTPEPTAPTLATISMNGKMMMMNKKLMKGGMGMVKITKTELKA